MQAAQYSSVFASMLESMPSGNQEAPTSAQNSLATMPDEPLIKQCRRRMQALRDERRSWDEHYKDLATHILPWSAQFIEDGDRSNYGAKRADPVDGTAREALRVLAAGMQGGLTPKSIPWFRLNVKNLQLLEYKGMREWLQRSTQLLIDILAKSNFYHVIAQNYEELALYGTSVMYVEEDFDTVIRFRALTVGEYYIAKNWQGKVDTLFRVFDMPVRNVVAEFGWSKVSERVRTMARDAPDAHVRLVHAVMPRSVTSPVACSGSESPWPCHMPFASYTFEFDAPDEGELLRESGYTHFPYLVACWATVGNNVYGYSPGMDALPDVKQLKIMQEEKADIVRKISNPPMIAPPELKGHYLSTASGEVSFADSRSGQGFMPVVKYDYNVSSLIPAITELQNSVKRAFFNELFRMFIGEGVQGITATEVLERRQERLSQIGPVLERLQSEIFAPLIELLLHRCEEVNILPEKPMDIDCMCMHVDYTSAICQSQRMVGLTSITQLAQFVGEIARTSPAVLDKFDADKAVDEYATMLGIPLSILRSDEDIEGLRAERAQISETLNTTMEQKTSLETKLDILERGVALAKELNSVDISEESTLTQIATAAASVLDTEAVASVFTSALPQAVSELLTSAIQEALPNSEVVSASEVLQAQEATNDGK